MKTFLPVNLPNYFTLLLRANMNSSVQINDNLDNHLLRDDSFLGLSGYLLKNDDKKNLSAHSLVRNLGWTGIRDRLTTLYLDYMENDFFSRSESDRNISYLFNLEENVKEFSVQGYSRAFMLGFYLKSVQIMSLKIDIDEYVLKGGVFDDFDPDVFELVSLSKSRNIKIDWALIMIQNFLWVYGKDELLKRVKRGSGYTELYHEMETEQKERYIQNCLTYGYSINEKDTFINDII